LGYKYLKEVSMALKITRPLIKLREVSVKSNIEIAPSAFVLSFKREFIFHSGQVIAIGISQDDDARLYSICSGINDEDIHILYNVKPDGKLTPPLSAFKPGNSIFISPPFGSYYGTPEPAYWIGTGTGIAPFYSMFRSGLSDNKILLHGGRTLDSFYFGNELLSVMGDRYIRCCSTDEAPSVYKGRVTQYLKEKKDLPADYKYFLCGSSEMVVDCREILLTKGIPYDNIIAEIYF
jgi:ferredoxin/flavodoxin---NADP+ reductase